MNEKNDGNVLGVDISLYDECERHEHCVVEIWKNSVTGDVSVGWWRESEEDNNG